jgi:hypothetical protein
MTEILKSDEAQQVVYGWAGKYVGADGKPLVDLQGDIIEPEEVEKAAVDFMLEHRASGIMHEGKSVGTIVASLVTTPEIVKALFGSEAVVPVGWLIGVKYPDKEVYKRVVSGELSMFSIQGSAEAEDAT